MKEIFKAIDDAYSILDKCIDKLLKGRITKDEKLEQEAYCDMEYAVNGTMQNLSYLEGRLKGKTLNEWIKVEDRLPEYEETVMVACHYKDDPEIDYIFCHRTDRNEVLTDKNGFAIIPDFNITHWLPIVPPKED